MGGTSAQWTALRGTSWRARDAETQGRFRAARARLAALPGIVVDEKRDRKRLAMSRGPRHAACRTFDCRAFAAMGLVEHCDPNRRIPDWEFAEEERGGH